VSGVRYQVSGDTDLLQVTQVVSDPDAMQQTGGRPRIESHRDLTVYQKALDYVDFIYELAESFPKRENFGMWSQITRAALSVPTNIPEGHARSSRKEYAYFLTLAHSSLMETETLLTVAHRRRYITDGQIAHGRRRLEEMSKMLVALRRKLIGDWKDTRKC